MASSRIRFPYIPGLFAFREIPAVLEVIPLLIRSPDLLLVHAHGYAHPRRVGMATHLGAVLNIPSIGVANRILAGMTAEEPGIEKGSSAPVLMDGETVGMAVRTREGSAPLYVSAGFHTAISAAAEEVLRWCAGHRLPEPIRLADTAARKMRVMCGKV